MLRKLIKSVWDKGRATASHYGGLSKTKGKGAGSKVEDLGGRIGLRKKK